MLGNFGLPTLPKEFDSVRNVFESLISLLRRPQRIDFEPLTKPPTNPVEGTVVYAAWTGIRKGIYIYTGTAWTRIRYTDR